MRRGEGYRYRFVESDPPPRRERAGDSEGRKRDKVRIATLYKMPLRMFNAERGHAFILVGDILPPELNTDRFGGRGSGR